ncbi:MAG: glutathione synthase [Proteobacteria bacterium]|nr:glutathione synthase [Pseudomonadota bacterium]
MKHAFIMDPLAQVKPHKDTTYFLMLAAQQCGHEVFHIDPTSLALEHDRAFARGCAVSVSDSHDEPFTVGPVAPLALETMDVVWMRKDPPFDRGYFYATLILDYLPSCVQVVNRPATIRDWNEKLAALRYPALTPPTLVSRDPAQIVTFLSDQGRITVKPVDGHGGKGIIFLDDDGEDVEAQLHMATHQGRHWVVAQKYLPAAQQGDKRILLLDGEPLGAILRVHAKGAELNNLDQGGTARPSTLDACDRQICDALADDLSCHGVRFAGIDIIGGMLIEVNITSPTGLQEMSRFDGQDYHHRVIQALEV